MCFPLFICFVPDICFRLSPLTHRQRAALLSAGRWLLSQTQHVTQCHVGTNCFPSPVGRKPGRHRLHYGTAYPQQFWPTVFHTQEHRYCIMTYLIVHTWLKKQLQFKNSCSWHSTFKNVLPFPSYAFTNGRVLKFLYFASLPFINFYIPSYNLFRILTDLCPILPRVSQVHKHRDESQN